MTPSESASEFWVADALPDGFVPVMVRETEAERSVFYASTDDTNDEFDAPLRVSAASEDEFSVGTRQDVEPVEIHDLEGFAVPLTGDGETYGIALTWQLRSDLWLTAAGSEPLTRSDVVEVAEGLVPVDAIEWNRLKRSVSMETRVGRVEPGATEVEAHSGRVDGDEYRLTVLVPDGYPLGPEDRRLNCYRLTFRGDSSGDLCDTHPWWLRVGGELFVFGPADPGTRRVRIGPYEGSEFEPAVVATVAVDRGPPGRFYVHPLADGVCFVEVSSLDLADDVRLGPIGPLPSNPEHPACLAALDGG